MGREGAAGGGMNFKFWGLFSASVIHEHNACFGTADVFMESPKTAFNISRYLFGRCYQRTSHGVFAMA